MQLVGATRGFIRKPFVGAAVIQGLLASLLALIALGGTLFLLREEFPQLFSVLQPSSLGIVAGVVVLSGVLICVVSTWLVVGRLVSLNKDELYY